MKMLSQKKIYLATKTNNKYIFGKLLFTLALESLNLRTEIKYNPDYCLLQTGLYGDIYRLYGHTALQPDLFYDAIQDKRLF